MNVQQHILWVHVLEKAAKAFSLKPEDLAAVRAKGIPEMLKWADEKGLKLEIPAEDAEPEQIAALERGLRDGYSD